MFLFNNDKLCSTYRITQKTCRLIVPCICSEFSGIKDKGIKLYKIYNSLEELKIHCTQFHNKVTSFNSFDKINLKKSFAYIQRKKWIFLN